MRILVFVALLLSATPFFAMAHSMGVSLERDLGEYRIDVGYDPAVLVGGDRIVFDLGTFTKKGAPVDFDYVWVRVTHDKKTLLATGVVRAEFGPTSLLYQIPSDLNGEMSIHVRYQKGDEALAETEFPLSVAAAPGGWSPWLLCAFGMVFGSVVGGAGAWYFMKRRRGVI